jgi:tetratricopeptide (TPR) repeat protein
MGTVYEASRTDGSFHKRVAIKVIRATLLTESLVKKFRREREILAGLDHPNIARILDGGTTATGRPYFVMEHVSGVRIDRYCASHRLGVDGRLDLFSRVCDAVQYAHDRLIVHCDLKPGNILITPEGGVKLLDFGIARILAEPSDSVPSADAASAMILTPEYASPEQVMGQPVTAATDVYLLGVLLYELLTGQHPLHGCGDLPHEVMSAVCERDPPKPSTVHPFERQLKGELDNIVMLALQKDPRRRYSSVTKLRDDIARYRSGLPVMAQGDQLSYRTRKFLRRNLFAVTAAALVVLSLTVGIVVSAGQASRARREQQAANQQRVIADVQRRFAQDQQTSAAIQQIRAEQKATEAGEQRALADLERANAEKRLGEMRALVTTLLFDLHDGIRDLAGSAGMRRLVLAKAQQYLEILAKESGNDLQLQRELASAYEKTGDLLHDAPGPAGPDDSSLKNYQKAFELRQAIARQEKAEVRAQRDLAFSLSKVGDGEFFNGQTEHALSDYEGALKMQTAVLQRNPSDPESQKVLGYIQNRRCIVLATAGDAIHAVEACRLSIAALDPVVLVLRNDRLVRRTLAATCAAYGNLLRHLNRIPEALTYLAKASSLFEALAAEQPNNVEYRRLIAYTQMYVAQALFAQDDRAGAMRTFSKAAQSMQTLISIDPTDSKAPAGLALTLSSMAAEMKKSGDLPAAERASSEAIELMRAVAERPGAGPYEWNVYADILLKSEIERLREPAKALDLALRASRATQETNPTFLDTLAWAYFRTGDTAAAVRTERKALSLVPAGNALGQGLRSELEQGLAQFEALP